MKKTLGYRSERKRHSGFGIRRKNIQRTSNKMTLRRSMSLALTNPESRLANHFLHLLTAASTVSNNVPAMAITCAAA
jgi:hypothetical protein